MTAARLLYSPLLLITALGCQSDPDMPPDTGGGTPTIMFENFTPTTWSLAITGGRAQLSMTSGTGATACGLAADQKQGLGAAGVQIILHLPDMVTGPCPTGNYTLMKCAAALGSEAYVPAGCAFYRKWDAQGATLGISAALTGTVTVSPGNATSCTLRVRLGFMSLGSSFSADLPLTNGTSAQPWCSE